MVTMEYAAEERKDIVSGNFKVKDSVPIPFLLAFASNWLTREPDRLLSVAIRGCAKDLNGIDFRYVFTGESHVYDMHRIGRWLEETVGKHNVRGWSVSSPTYIIK